MVVRQDRPTGESVNRARVLVVAAVVTTTCPLFGLAAAPAVAAGGDCGGTATGAYVRLDVNGDGCADAVVGMPNRTVGGKRGAGAIEIDLGSPTHHLRARSVLVTAEHPRTGDHFGTSVITTDEDQGPMSAVVIGAPGRDVGGVRGSGAVVTLPGAATWADVVRVPNSAFNVITSRPHEDARLGAALAVAHEASSPTVDVVYAGAPGWGVSGERSAGAVLVATIGRLSGNSAPRPQVLTEDSSGVSGRARAGDRFGSAIATLEGFDTNVVIGAPGKTVAGQVGAGAVMTVSHSTTIAPQMLTQASTRDPNAPEQGDHFGAVLASYIRVIYIAVPDEDVGKSADAGIVEQYVLGRTAAAYHRGFKQGVLGYPGTPQAGDHFGAAMSVVSESEEEHVLGNCYDSSLAIGVPGQDFGGLSDAGEVDCPQSPPLRMGAELPGRPQSHARVGASLATIESGRWVPAPEGCDCTGSPWPYLVTLIGAPGIRAGRGGVIEGTMHSVDIWHRTSDPVDTLYGASLGQHISW